MGKWLVDGFDLSTAAWNVRNRSAGYSTGGKKGKNQEVPGQDGEIWTPNKPAAAGRVNLRMFVVGSDRAGLMPVSKTRQLQLRENLEELMSLFTQSSSLCELVRVESAGYGALNRFTNPAAGRVVLGGVGYTNQVQNPRQVTQGPRETLRNLIPDPSLINGTELLIAENLVHDPSHGRYRSATPTLIARNWWSPTSYEVAHGWAVGDDLTSGWWITAANTTAMIQSANGARGGQVLRLLASTGLAANASLGRRAPMSFPTATSPNFRIRMRRSANTTTTRTIQLRAIYYNASDVQTSASAWSSAITVPSGNAATSWVDISLPGSVLGTNDGTQMSIEFRTGEAWLTNDAILLDAGSVSSLGSIPTEAAPFFDGDDSWAQWNGINGRSLSNLYGNIDPNWVPTGTRNAFNAWALSTGWDKPGSAIGFVAHRQVPTGTQQFTLSNIAAPTVGTPYTLRFRGRALVGSTCTVELCTVEGGVTTSRGSVSIVGANGSSAWDSGSGMVGTIKSYAGPTWTPTSGQTFVVRVTVPVRATGEQQLQLTALAVTDYYTPKSGYSTPDYGIEEWAGDPYQSKTTIKRNMSPMYSTKHEARGDNILALIATSTATTVLQMVDQPIVASMLTNGFQWSAQVSSYNQLADNQTLVQPQVRAVAQAIGVGSAVLATYTGPTVSPSMPAGNENLSPQVQVTIGNATLPAGTQAMRVRLEMLTPVPGLALYVYDQIIASRYSPGSVVWFDGAHGGGTWTGAANNSPSILGVIGPVGYGVVQGNTVKPAAGVKQITATSSGTADVVFVVDLSAPAGLLRVGCEASATVDCDLYVQVWNGSDQRGEAFLGSLYSVTNLTLMDRAQTAVSASAPGDQLRVVFRPVAASSGVQSFRLGSTYLYSVVDSHLPRVSGNQMPNATWQQSTRGWVRQVPLTGKLGVVTTIYGKALQSNENVLVSNAKIICAAGQSVWVWAEVQTAANADLRVNWFNSAGTALTGQSVATSPGAARPRSMQGTAVAPANAAWCTVRIIANSPTLNLYRIYAARVLPNRDIGPNVDPLVWAYFDGASVSDVVGTKVRWLGAANASVSATVPATPADWDAGGAVVLASPPYRPATSRGNVVAFPGFGNLSATPVAGGGGYGGFLDGYLTSSAPPDPVVSDKIIARTKPILLEGPYVSGQVSVARATATALVTVRVVGVDDQFGANPTTWWETTMATLDEVITWRDVPIGQAWYQLEVEYGETVPNTGWAVVLDNVLLLNTDDRLGVEYPGYFDGSSSSAGWVGQPDESMSINYAGARRCYAEFAVEPIDVESMAAGTRVELDVAGLIPAAFWEDLAESRMSGQTAEAYAEFELTDFAGSTARNTSTVITLRQTLGTGSPTIKLTDKKTGAWLLIEHQLLIGDVVTVDCRRFLVSLTRAGVTSSLGMSISRGGASPLLSLTPFGISRPPVLVVESDPFDGIRQVDLVGRRKYVIA